MRRIPRPLARAPIGIFTSGFGWVFRGLLVMVEHTGRKSGLSRHVVLEVIAAEVDAVVVVAGYGAKAQWFRNVLADPRVRLWHRRARGVPARASRLPPPEAREVFERYRREKPSRLRALGRTLEIPVLLRPGPFPEDIGETLPLVRITRTPTEPTRT
ncbi:hypothetical protein GCM10023169_20060 [Georgenia halophila]|uniref:Nitroreductase family deazaflavin-dependent oxidoreductase n=1 Tax=Georgenia halophila TaxID=620889 RepID=A0ABP8L8U2_9MICO